MNATPDPVSIGNMLERQVPLEWFEGVALVAGLCAAVADTESPYIPQPHDILVTPEGAIVVRSGVGDDIAALPRLLSALLDGASPPAPLRLFVVHAVSSESYRSARSFGSALAYYERPGRTELVQTAYARYLETPAVPPPPPIEPIEEEQAQEQTPAPEREGPRRTRRWAAGAVTVACASAIALILVAASRQTLAGSGDSRAASDATASVEADEASAPDATVVSDPLLAAGKRAARPRPAAAPTAAGGDQRSGARETIAWTMEGPSATMGSAAPVPLDEPRPELSAAIAPDLEIYTADTPNIEPPILRDPERLPTAVHVVVGDVAHAIELIITEKGAVGRVNMLTPSGRITDMMLLSAAKTWTFQPAMKDGQPVRFRLLLNWGPFR